MGHKTKRHEHRGRICRGDGVLTGVGDESNLDAFYTCVKTSKDKPKDLFCLFLNYTYVCVCVNIWAHKYM